MKGEFSKNSITKTTDLILYEEKERQRGRDRGRGKEKR